MRRALLLACLGLLAAAGSASAATRTLRVTVPLDRTGAVPGKVSLRVAVHRHGSLRSRGLVIGLLGGPGQAGAAAAGDLASELGKAGSGFDVAAYDPRGTGRSGRISCPEVERRPFPGVPSTVAQCAARLGGRSGLYTTQAAVEDLEAVRAALKVDKVVLFGTSYGTRVALAYAAAHPAHVRRLLLDSTTPADGIDPLLRSTWAAIPRVLRDLCAGGACRGVTPDPAVDLRRAVGRLGLRGVRGKVARPGGRRVVTRLTELDVIDLLYAGDFDPFLRSRMPAALRAGAHGDMAPLRRLAYDTPGETLDPKSGDSDGLYYATNCEESPFPWSRAAAPATRLAQAKGLLGTLPAATWGPFDLAAVLVESDMPSCARWPQRAAAPPALAGPLPDVPVLIFSGGTDIRTPTADARRVAAAFPHSTLVVSRWAGHSVLDGFEGCEDVAVQAFLDGRAVPACHGSYDRPDIEPAWPSRLAVAPRFPGIAGTRGRLVGAVQRGLDGVAAEIVEDSFSALTDALSGDKAPVLRRAGLHGGEWQFGSSLCLRLVRYSAVPGVRASGRWCIDEKHPALTLRVDAGRRLRGTLVFAEDGHVRGTIGGRRVRGYRRPPAGDWSFFATSTRRAMDAGAAPRPVRRDHVVASLVRR